MKNRHLLAALIMIFVATALPFAAAQPYVGAAAGRAKVHGSCSDTVRCELTDLGYKAFAGFWVSPYVGAELAYVDLGEATARADLGAFGSAAARFNVTGAALSLRLAYPMDAFTFSASGGVSSLRSKVTVDFLGASDAYAETNSAALWGAGIDYALMRQLGARLGWEQYRIKLGEGKSIVTLVSLAATYRFD